MNPPNVHAIGSEIHMRGSPAVVIGITIRGADHVTYEVVWWKDGGRYCQWVEGCEIDESPVNPLKIWFHP